MRHQAPTDKSRTAASRRASGRNAAPAAPTQVIITGRASGRCLAPENNAA
ncbi:MAG: hypothetical protein IPP14_13825 [Planctomycetes bacterium]|nr:hypothetical protein [Planctomycetota bacterium]